MFNGITQHYNQYYHYDIPSGDLPGDVVNSLYDHVMRNDKNALEQVLKILASNTYYMVCSRLDGIGSATRENVDDMMQIIRMEILKLSFRGFPQAASQENFYPYLIGIVENCVKNFRSKHNKCTKREQYDTKEYSVLDTLEKQGEDGNQETPENVLLQKETKFLINALMKLYIETLQETKILPYKVLTYCYAILLPQLFKKSHNKEFLRRVAVLSARKSGKPNSYYNEERGCLEGDITRDSVILMGWALEAIYGQNVRQLDQEFLELYDMERIADIPLEWGVHHQSGMEKICDGIPIKQIVITEQFEKNAIKNWPVRVARALLEDIEKKIISEKIFQERSVDIVEEMLR